MDELAGWPVKELIGFDLETTGVDRFSDVPVSFALVTWENGLVTERVGQLVDPGREIPAGATGVHGITTAQARDEGLPLEVAIGLLADRLVDAGRRGVPIAGMKLDYDLTILDVQCRRLDGRGLAERGWTGPVLDAVVLDRHVDRYRKGRRTLVHLCEHYGVTIDNAHDAVADAEASVGVVLAIASRFPELTQMTAADLHHAEAQWHREWATSFDSWRQGKGQPPLDPRDFEWPVADAGGGGSSAVA